MINSYLAYMQDTQWRIVFILIALWDLIWKGMALWKAAQNKQRNWFILLLLVNSLGIVPILYIRFFQKSSVKKHR
ncbi:MAG: DUF5652 family protein [Patescibacteria group bacterium]